MENEITQNGFVGVDIGILKIILLLYADDIVIFSESALNGEFITLNLKVCDLTEKCCAKCASVQI